MMAKQEWGAVGHRLRQQRSRMRLTQEQFAEPADIGAGYYGQIEAGTSQMSIGILIKVSRTAQPSMEHILFREEDQSALQATPDHCSPRELHLAEKVLQPFFLRSNCARKKAPAKPALQTVEKVRWGFGASRNRQPSG